MQGAGCRVHGAGCRVQGAGCRVQGAGVTRDVMVMLSRRPTTNRRTWRTRLVRKTWVWDATRQKDVDVGRDWLERRGFGMQLVRKTLVWDRMTGCQTCYSHGVEDPPPIAAPGDAVFQKRERGTERERERERARERARVRQKRSRQ